MNNYFYKINAKILSSFKMNVHNSINTLTIQANTKILKIINDEITKLFKKISGRLSSKRNIPSVNDYPDSKQINNLINDIAFDIDRLYKTQFLVEDDIRNVINYNSLEREKTLNNFNKTYSTVYSTYALMKGNITGKSIPPGNAFELSNNVTDCEINKTNKPTLKLALLNNSSITKNCIDVNGVSIHIDDYKNYKLYPGKGVMDVGSWLKKSKNDQHFNIKNETKYRTNMIDIESSNTGISVCEFETVASVISEQFKINVKNELSKDMNISKNDIIIDDNLCYRSVKYSNSKISNISQEIKKFKILIPFKSAPLTNEISIRFMPIDGKIPSINLYSSRIYSVDGNNASSIKEIDKNDSDGLYKITFDKFLVPSRLELSITYNNWKSIPFMMSCYQYSGEKTMSLTDSNGTTIAINVSKKYIAFVDTEANIVNEKSRAYNSIKNM